MPGVVDDFNRAFEAVVLVEGGFSDDPNDPGGKTNLGLSDAADGKIDGAHKGTRLDGLTIEQAKAHYHHDYWQRAYCDEMWWPLSLFVFDAAVNQGVGPAVKMLQKAAGVTQDGIFGRKTKGAIAAADQRDLCTLFMAERALRYFGTRNFDRYGRGWLKRLFLVTVEGV